MSERRQPVHSVLGTLEIADDCLVFGGMKLTDIATEVGRTPFYAYDLAAMTTRIEALRQALPKAVHLHYAMKANPMSAVVRHMVGLVDGVDVASAGEFRIALGAGAQPEQISFAGPGKTREELSDIVMSGLVINLESEREMYDLARLARQNGVTPRVAVRVNPDFELKASGMKMAGGPKQFGIDAEKVPDLLLKLAALDLEFVGFHIFSGSQNLRSDAICEAQIKSVDLAIDLAAAAPAPVRTLNIGGGFGIPYFPGEVRLDIEPIAANLQALLPRVEAAMPGARVVLELGRYLVGEAGIYVCRVIERKLSRGQVFLITDGGLHHHLAASGNFGQVIRKNYPVLIGNRVAGGAGEVASVVGPLCTPLDLLADRMDVGRGEAGDLVVVLQSGAYGLTASPTAFLSHAAPAEVTILTGAVNDGSGI